MNGTRRRPNEQGLGIAECCGPHLTFR